MYVFREASFLQISLLTILFFYEICYDEDINRYGGCVFLMATKSILKSININGKNQVHNLIKALEYAEEYRGKDVILSRTFSEIKGADIKKFFEAKK